MTDVVAYTAPLTAEPTLSPEGAKLRRRTQPLAPHDDQYGWAHAHLSEGLSKVYEEVGQVFDPPDDVPPGAPLLDVATCPLWALPWLAQISGVTIPPGLDEDTTRSLIRDVSGWARGSVGALRAAAQLALTGTKTVYFRERDEGEPYRLQVRTLTAETPDPAQVQALLLSQKPGGIVLAYSVVDHWDWQQVTIEVATWADLVATYQDWDHVVQKEPL